MAFNPDDRIIKLRGQDYLEVKWRLVWFRDRHPDGSIVTQIVSVNEETGLVLAKATITNKEGAILATGHGTARDDGKKVWSGKSIEKAETSAIGRALAVAGFGTQFSGDEIQEDDNGVDSAVNRAPNNPPRQQPPADNSVVQTAQANGAKVTKMDKSDTSEKQWTEDEAKTFITRWRNQALTDSEVLAALGVTRLGEWKHSRKAADAAVDNWLAGRINEPKAS